MQASKNCELICKRKINLHCHTLIFFVFFGSFIQTCFGLLEALSWYPCFFLDLSGHSSTNPQNLARIFSWCDLAVSKSRYLKNHAILNFLFGHFRVPDSGTRLCICYYINCVKNFQILPVWTLFTHYIISMTVSLSTREKTKLDWNSSNEKIKCSKWNLSKVNHKGA